MHINSISFSYQKFNNTIGWLVAFDICIIDDVLKVISAFVTLCHLTHSPVQKSLFGIKHISGRFSHFNGSTHYSTTAECQAENCAQFISLTSHKVLTALVFTLFIFFSFSVGFVYFVDKAEFVNKICIEQSKSFFLSSAAPLLNCVYISSLESR